MEPKENVFWLVWSPSGKYPPSRMHSLRGEAKLEAERLARKDRGQSFYVLEAQSVSKAPPNVETTELEYPPASDELVF